MNKADEKVKEYLDRAFEILRDISFGMKGKRSEEWTPHVIEMAKMIQAEEHKESEETRVEIQPYPVPVEIEEHNQKKEVGG